MNSSPHWWSTGGFEAGLDVAVEAPRSATAPCAVVFISDEDDASERSVTIIEALERAAPGLHIHAITGDLPAGCAETASLPTQPRATAAARSPMGSDGPSARRQRRTSKYSHWASPGSDGSFPLLDPRQQHTLVWVQDAAVEPAEQHA